MTPRGAPTRRRRAPRARSDQGAGDATGVVLSGLGTGLILTVIPIALCDYTEHGIFIADKRLVLLTLGMLLGACAGALRLRWRRQTDHHLGYTPV